MKQSVGYVLFPHIEEGRLLLAVRMYVCVCVCMYMYVYVCMHVCVHMYAPMCVVCLFPWTWHLLWFAVSSCATFEVDLTLLCVSPGAGADSLLYCVPHVAFFA